MPQPKIQSVRAREVVVPARPGIIHSPGFTGTDQAVWDQKPICLLEVHADDGLVGYGEVVRGHAIDDLRDTLAQLPGNPVHPVTPQTLPPELRPHAFYGVRQSMPLALWDAPSPVVPALEQAALDLLGKRLGQPAVDLLGGACRESVAVDYWCGRQSPDDLAGWVRDAVDRGFTGIKMKSSLGDPVVEQVEAIRATAGNDFRITIDPVFQWLGPADSLGLFRALEPLAHNGLLVEDPFPHEMPEHWHRIRSATTIPLAWHARGLADLRAGLKADCADCHNLTSDQGSPAEFLVQAHALEVLGLTCWQGSTIELGVGLAARLHTAAAARACVMPCDFPSPLVREHTLVDREWDFTDGALAPPEGPGLGVTPDLDALEHYKRDEALFA